MTERVRSLSRERALSARLSALIELGFDLSLQHTPEQLADLFCRTAQGVVSAKHAAIGLLDDHGPGLRYYAARGMTDVQIANIRSTIDPRANVFARVLDNGEAQRLCRLNGDPTNVGLPDSHPPIHSFLAVPIKSNAHAYGWLYFVDKPEAEEFSYDDEQFALTLAAQLLPIYENFVLYDRLKLHANRLEAEIADRKHAEVALRESRSFLEQAQEVGGVGSWVSELGDDTSLWWSRQTYRMFGVPEDTPLTLDTFFSVVHPDDRPKIMHAVEHAIATRTPYSISHRIVLADGSQRWVVEHADVVFDSTDQPSRLIGVVQDITERKEQQDKIARLTRLYALLSGINSTIVRVHERQALLDEACRIAVEHGRFGIAWIGFPQPGNRKVKPVACKGLGLGELDQLRRIDGATGRVERGTLGEALRTKRAAFCNDIQAAPRVGAVRDEAVRRGYRSVIALPLVVRDEVAGVMVLYAHEAGFFDEEELKLLNELAGDIAFGLQFIEKEERLDYLAYYDVLTGLPNSKLFHDRLTQFLHGAKPDEGIVSVIVIDLNRFTQLNDTLGRHVGDVLLRAVAERLGSALQEPFSVARISADTFAVAVADLKQSANVADILNHRIFDALHRPFSVGDHEVRISARAGISLYPGDGADAATLFKNAEAALRQARFSGERYLYYAPEINARVADKIALETRLRHAVEFHQFVLHYQPKIDTKSGRVLGLEALIRWDDGRSGLVLPEHFIDVLEETGLILEIGDWVIDRALADYRRWCDQGLNPPRIAVNVSPLQLKQPDFSEKVRKAIMRHGVGPESIEFELTESLIMEDIDTNIETLRKISDVGTTIAVDDFGTGYSSLRYLAMLPVDSLKIDQLFIMTMANDRDSKTIVSSIISLAHSLKLSVVAEGVDSEEQSKILKRLGCDQMQGFLFSPALSPEGVEVSLRETARSSIAH